jgi:mono/diheme cytochrome c family protein
MIAAATCVLVLGACGSEGISVPEDSAEHPGAVLFAERCSGCHSFEAAGAQGSQQREERIQGPNLDERAVGYEDALFAIRNGGFSGVIMPQNIVVGEQAEQVAQFIDEYSGSEAQE